MSSGRPGFAASRKDRQSAILRLPCAAACATCAPGLRPSVAGMWMRDEVAADGVLEARIGDIACCTCCAIMITIPTEHWPTLARRAHCRRQRRPSLGIP
jgi:xanthine dehydrogenase iron-sulfur cluster and FAD-binding subunit A